MVRLFYTCSLLVLAVLASPFHSVAPAEAAGPSFSCAQPKDALDRLTCSDGALAASEIRMVQAYYALRHTADAERQNQLKTEFLRFVVDIRARCGLPSVQPGRDQSAFVPPAPSAACVRQLYDGQRNKWAGRLSGPAAEEAARPPDGNIGLQARLRDLGLLPKEATVDGVFGTATRSAVTAWQLANGRPGTGFLADADAALLGGAAIASAAPKDRWADVTVAPLATIDYHGPTVEASVGDLKVALAAGNSRDPGLCGGGKGALLPMISTTTTGAAGCKVIGLKLTMGDRVVLEQAVTAFETNADFDRLGVKVTFRRLVPGSEIPQVLLQGYTGGAHCCTHTVALVGGRDGAWKAFGLGGLDGDVGYAYLDPARDGSTLLVSAVGEFNYRFASYAGSYDTDRIQAFTDGKLVDVTRESRFLPFLRSELRRMEASWRANQGGERNGYLAAWVAQKLLVGEFDDAWRTMLRSLYRIDKFTKAARIYGVVADPVRHSVSPQVHNRAFQSRRLDAVYVPLLVNPNQLRDFFQFAEDLPLSGFSVTIPHKRRIMRYLDQIDPLARRIGAVNTVIRKAGKWRGSNTDAGAVAGPLSKLISLPKATALIVGNGGAARSAACALADAGTKVAVTGRNPDRVRALARLVNGELMSHEQAMQRHFDIVINATPVGMWPNVSECPFADKIPGEIVFDMVYNPLETFLIRRALDQGKKVIPGLKMFIEQAVRQFEIWIGEPAPRAAMETAALEALETRYSEQSV